MKSKTHLVDDINRQRHQCKVIDYHGLLELEGLSIGHDARAQVEDKEQVAQQNDSHGNRTLHQEMILHSRIWLGGNKTVDLFKILSGWRGKLNATRICCTVGWLIRIEFLRFKETFWHNNQQQDVSYCQCRKCFFFFFLMIRLLVWSASVSVPSANRQKKKSQIKAVLFWFGTMVMCFHRGLSENIDCQKVVSKDMDHFMSLND